LAGERSSWLCERETEWRSSGESWDVYLRDWTARERLHRGHDILRELDARFERRRLEYGPYFFPDLNEVSEADEQAAIDAGLIQATRIQYAGSVP
jgi:hypothetical protein